MEDGILSKRTVLYLLEALDEKQLRQILGRMKEDDPERTVIESFWNRIHAGYEGERIEDLFEGALSEAIQAYIKRSKMKQSDIYNIMGISRQQWKDNDPHYFLSQKHKLKRTGRSSGFSYTTKEYRI